MFMVKVENLNEILLFCEHFSKVLIFRKRCTVLTYFIIHIFHSIDYDVLSKANVIKEV